MAHHKSALKRIRQTIRLRERNRFYGKTTRNMVRKLRAMTDKKEAEAFYPNVVSNIDQLAKKNIIHKNKASNLKSKLAKFVSSL
jgi:small subunit ribosomal protein S20